MARQPFALQPFPSQAAAPDLQIEGWLERRDRVLDLAFQLREPGPCPPADPILWPAPDGDPQRRDGLWEHTCLELFLAQPGEERYWEFNLSPRGHWNVYRLDGYRDGLRPDPDYGTLPFRCSPSPQPFDLAITVPLPAALAAAPSLQAAVTAVVKRSSGRISYWALHHGGPEADFHRRDGFRMRI